MPPPWKAEAPSAANASTIEKANLPVRERIELLLDEGTFEEMDKLVQHRCRDFLGMDQPGYSPGMAW